MAWYNGGIDKTLWARDNDAREHFIWIVPAKPSNGPDTLVRFLAPHLMGAFQELRQTALPGLIIDNVPGGDGSKAYAKIFHAAPDGYTFGEFKLVSIPESITSKPSFDPRQFTYLLRTGTSIRVLATRKEGFKNWAEMMLAARKKDIKWAAGDFGKAAHIDSIIAVETMGIPAKLMNFIGIADNINALIKGDAQVGLYSRDAIAALLKAGEFRLLVLFSEKSGLPGVPSVCELGYPDLAETISEQRYLVGPPGMPPGIVHVISTSFQKVLAKPEVIAWAERMGFPILPLYGEAATKIARQVIDAYDKMTPAFLKYLK